MSFTSILWDTMYPYRFNNLGTIRAFGPDNTVYLGNTFAPGIWAGSEDSGIIILDDIYIVKKVLFDDKAIQLDRLDGLRINVNIERYAHGY